jgi:hypothetical protein
MIMCIYTACIYVHTYTDTHIPGVRPSGMHPDRNAPSTHTVHAAQSESLVAEHCFEVYLPGAHCVQVEHCVLTPAYVAYVPSGHTSHSPSNEPAQFFRYSPAEHSLSHVVHSVRYIVPAAYVPGGQSKHAPANFQPQPVKTVPGLHVREEHILQFLLRRGEPAIV